MDRSVVERSQGGDREAFLVLVDKVRDSRYAIAYCILRESGAAEYTLENELVSRPAFDTFQFEREVH